MDNGNDTSFLRGLLNDFTSLAVVLLFVLVLTLIMGFIFVMVALTRDAFVFLGIILSIIMVPIVIIIGLALNLDLFKKIPYTRKGFWKHFREESVPYACYTESYRNRFILQRFTFLGIMVGLFFFFLIFTGIMTIIPELCCIFAPISIPSILITVTIPAMAWISFTYAFDPYEPEPRAMIIIGVLWGMMSTFPSLFFNTFNAMWMEPLGMSTAVFSAPVFEELFKSLGFILIFSQIKDETDGMIYGATFGAGFSLMENLVYGGQSIVAMGGIGFVFTVGFRSFFNIIGHMLGPAIIGMLIGAFKYRSKEIKKKVPVLKRKSGIDILIVLSLVFIGYSFSVINHGLWNFLAGFEDAISILLLFLLGFFQIGLFITLVLVSFFLATGRYNKGLRDYRSTHPYDMQQRYCN